MITLSAFGDEIAEDLKVQMDTCAALGIMSIDVRGIDGKNVSSMTIEEARRYMQQMEDRGFSVFCIGSPIGKVATDADFDSHLDLLKHCFDVARAFRTDQIRIFSFYPSEGRTIDSQRSVVIERMAAMVEVAESADIVLLHENERAIYGAKPEGVKDLFAAISSDHFKSIFDPANFVVEGVAPYDDAWLKGLAELTYAFHIKDHDPSRKTCVPAGQGAGQLEQIFADLKVRNWSGGMTLEPHLAATGQFGGFTGPKLFAEAAEALKGLCNRTGLAYQ